MTVPFGALLPQLPQLLVENKPIHQWFGRENINRHLRRLSSDSRNLQREDATRSIETNQEGMQLAARKSLLDHFSGRLRHCGVFWSGG